MWLSWEERHGRGFLRAKNARRGNGPHCAGRRVRRRERGRKSRPAPFGPVKPSGMHITQMTWVVRGSTGRARQAVPQRGEEGWRDKLAATHVRKKQDGGLKPAAMKSHT